MEKKKNFENIGAVSAPFARPEILLVKNGEDVKIGGARSEKYVFMSMHCKTSHEFWQEKVPFCVGFPVVYFQPEWYTFAPHQVVLAATNGRN